MILLLDFTYNLDEGSKDWDDYYSRALSEQWEGIQKRYNIKHDLQTFIEEIFSRYREGEYYLSIPNLLRDMKKDKNGYDKYYRNIVIRSTYTNNLLPKDKSIILIGDVKISKVMALNIKGIEVIDNGAVGQGEKPLTCRCKSAFETKTIQNGVKVPDFNENNIHFLPLILDEAFMSGFWNQDMGDFNEADKAYASWRKYIDFRKYYLDIQGQKAIEIDGVEILDTYSVNSRDYMFNKETYEPYLLDEEFGKGEQIILTEQVGDSDSFPLVKVFINTNRKDAMQDVDKRSNKPKIEGVIARFTSLNNDIALSSFGDLNKGKTISLDKRYKFLAVEIEPNVNDVILKFDNKQQKQFVEIDNKYAKIISDEVQKYIDIEEYKLKRNIEDEIEIFKEELSNKFNEEVSINSDINIIKEYTKRNFKKDKQNNIIEIVSLEELYIERNKKLIKNKEIELNKIANETIQSSKLIKKKALEQKYAIDIQKDKESIAIICEQDKEIEIEKKIKDETIIQYQAYFQIEGNDAGYIRKDVKQVEPKFIVIDSTAERVKIERQEKALTAFFQGYVKNPFLANYLFSPKSLKSTKKILKDEINWVLEDPLNEKQKEAVIKALASESIFLLQGPPGTGKTQVIAELVAQYTRQGKKVLISSETHKAIDNVFERLPKDPNIRPIRLIPNKNAKKETDYSPDKLLENFYFNIISRLEKEVKISDNFKERKDSFYKEYEAFCIESEELNKNERLLNITTKTIKTLEVERAEYQKELNKIQLLIEEKQSIEDSKYEDMLRKGIDIFTNKIDDKELDDLRLQLENHKKNIADKNAEIDKITTGETYANMREKRYELIRKIEKFFTDFKIKKSYQTLDETIEIIGEEWISIEKKDANEYKNKIPMYQEISKQLRSKSILESDTEKYTKELYENANVFGITATSRDRFSQRDNEGLQKCGLADLNIREQGIDVVIIDEVSKLSFIDLLIPILYGKTVILVGDHRQLPPMYDLRNLKKEELVGLDEEHISHKLNEKYTEMYETCFFKSLYENIDSEYKVMLTKQYRCHEDIMRVFNNFYGAEDGKGLELGIPNQNQRKQHYLDIRINNKAIIDSNKHIYFINSNEFDEGDDGSTSRHNKQEAEVVTKLLSELDNACGHLTVKHNLKVNKELDIDERPSAGVICTYGEQAGKIKRSGIISRCQNFNKQNDNKLVISTVDDFQGDERDIIIVSMVRNPRRRSGNYDFVKKFERINVALSRARKMLIVVGNINFLSEVGLIDLPDLDGGKIKSGYPVYRKIIETISHYGKILEAEDILGEKQYKGGK
jgi:superfamily I DNA and/or RNA helicase